MKIAVFGATGRTGLPLIERALDGGHEVVAHTRSPEKLPQRDRLVVVGGDAYTGAGVVEAVSGVDAIVSVLGQGSNSPGDLLTVSGDHILGAMAETGVGRLVVLVGAGVREEGESVTLAGRAMGLLLRVVAGDVLDDATEHVRRVKATDPEWSVVRAPRLTEGGPEGAYRVGDVALGFDAVDRADVAACLLDRVENGDYVREMPKVGPA
ncbi:NAD(P)-dependent oxidoreductase [Natronorarus salvus]|uniref:NAD(P)-dependent oxidoreductase n=1 Tax=Natronorarus salvus TaxID=3117733 RepID=UPI002F268C32